MDFNAVVLAHVNWKRKFVAHLEGRDQLDASLVERDDQCELGQWIYSSPEMQAVEGYEELKQRHAEFHRAAAAALRSSQGISRESALRLVEFDSAYGRASANCINAITKVRERMQKAEAQRH